MRALKVGVTGKRKRDPSDGKGELFHVFDTTRTGEYCLRYLTDRRTETMSEAQAQQLIALGHITGVGKRKAPDALMIDIEQDLSAFPKRDIAEAHRRREYCDAILRHAKPSPHWYRWPLIIDEVRLRLGHAVAPHWKTVGTWLRTYIKHNLDFRSLIPRHGRKGRLRLRVEPTDEGKLISDAIDFWLDGENGDGTQPTMKEAHERLKDSYRAAMEELPQAAKWKAPCYGTFCRMITDVPEHERVRRRDGERAAETLFMHGGPGKPALYPLEAVEIDDTWDDHFLCNDDRTSVLGRPYLTVAFDKATAMPLGVHISFDPPSASTALECLKNVVLPKAWLVEEFPHIGPWNAYGPPREVIVDNGSAYRSDDFRDACARIGAVRGICKVSTPEFKGGVERAIRTKAQQLRLPGLAGTNPDKNGNPTPEAVAFLTLSDYREAVLNYLINEYAQNWHRGIAGVPAQRWKELTKDFTPELPDEIDLAGAFGLLRSATLKKTGLVYLYVEYRSKHLTNLHRRLGNVETWFRVDSQDLSKIHVIDPDTKKLVPTLASDQKYASGLTLYEHKEICKLMAQEKKDWENSDERWAARQRYRRNLESILARGKIRDKRRAARVLSPGATTPDRPPEHVLEHDVPVDIPSDDSVADDPVVTGSFPADHHLDDDGLIQLPIAE